MGIEVIYTAESTASGGGRDGHVKSSDDRIDLDTRPPKEAGCSASGITAEVALGADADGGYGISARLIGYLPGLTHSQAQDLMHKAHQVCPYSKATRGNIDVTLSVKV
ncbi:organic hydroperoxide resistance protein [Candidatus Mycolicibacterium alkanivorans]|uniref:Organic hydroperoxide resistance protein n=1 Tax=Candidatus Mycolicibacterium alkanivorans TaxID=2954114 RepID=A0ABS9YT41_9MYCO|nr:organic hydroperoxide resistance protein [Candidatus Mycolicibacterium alkanivorans]MCI4674361.1 organic hydroperoxide resistance protein [Candidatus Mycolicibacterium alkanivorans]